MMFRRTIVSALSVLSIALMLVGCHTMTGQTAGRYIDDTTITTQVKSKLAADHLASLTKFNVTTQNGVVYLTGNVDTPDRAQRAVDLARGVKGVRDVVNQIQVASATPPSVVNTPPTSASPTVVTTAPAATSNVAAGQPPVDVTGTVAHYDPQAGTVTLTDGRIIRLSPTASVWHSGHPTDVQPGQQVYIHNAVPVALQPPASSGAAGSWHFATVSRVDAAANMLYLTDGTALQIQPSTKMTVNGQPITLSQVQPGAEVAIMMPAGTVSNRTPSASTAGASALPRSTAQTTTSSQIVIFNAPVSR